MFSNGAVYSLTMNDKKVNKVEADLTDVIPKEGFANLLQSKVGLSKEAALKIFPDLSKLISRGVEAFERLHNKATDSNNQSQEKYMEHEAFLAEVHAEQLRLETLTPEERSRILDDLEKSADRAFEKDSENKAHIESIFKLAGKGILGALALVVVVLSAKSISDNEKK